MTKIAAVQMDQSEEQVPLFEPVEYADLEAARFVCGNQVIELARYAQAVASGTQLIMQIVVREGCRKENDQPPLFNGYHLGVLQELAIASCGMLADKAAVILEDASRRLEEERRAS